ncbi:hypothetical protein OG21DRAFT_1491132 [Imleria badia]|nr:hypothetical protein OG21DRAFT_1491132 [Imleria badia]
MDIANFLWTHMSTNSLGRTPTNILCETLYIKAIQCRQMVQSNWVPEHDENSGPHIPRAFRCANYLIHMSTDLSHVGIIPPISEVSSDFKRKLKNSLDTSPYGRQIFHGNPESDDPVGSELFGNIVFCNLVQKALFDSDNCGWFGFLKDTDGPNGPTWTLLVSASCYTTAYVSTWLIDAVDDFCSGMTPSFSDGKVQKVNGMVNNITDLFNKIMLGFPGVSLDI